MSFYCTIKIGRNGRVYLPIDVLNVQNIIINVNKRVYYETITNVSKC